MRQIIVICGENELRCSQILELISKNKKDVEIVPKITTSKTDNIDSKVVTNREFWDMAEQGKFFEIIGSHDGYYGVTHINQDNVKDQYMVHSVGVSLAIKKKYPKAITIYILSEEKLENFKTTSNYPDVEKLEFLVVDSDLMGAAKKIEEIVCFIEENGMKSI